jgi:hypothetical protein
MKHRDLESEVWKLLDSIDEQNLEVVDRKLKSLDLLVKMRVAGQKIKPDDEPPAQAGRGDVAAVLKRLNK